MRSRNDAWGLLGSMQREDNIVALRKNKRDENLMKRRNLAMADAPISEGQLSVAGGLQSHAAQVSQVV